MGGERPPPFTLQYLSSLKCTLRAERPDTPPLFLLYPYILKEWLRRSVKPSVVYTKSQRWASKLFFSFAKSQIFLYLTTQFQISKFFFLSVPVRWCRIRKFLWHQLATLQRRGNPPLSQNSPKSRLFYQNLFSTIELQHFKPRFVRRKWCICESFHFRKNLSPQIANPRKRICKSANLWIYDLRNLFDDHPLLHKVNHTSTRTLSTFLSFISWYMAR